MAEGHQPRGADWADILEVLHRFANTMTVRAHYQEGHPAIAKADSEAALGFLKVLERLPELVVALIDNEFVICERPMPDLRSRLHVVADAMTRHEIECLVFQRGMNPGEASFLGRMMARPIDPSGKVREQTQAGLTHILLRFAELRQDQQWSRAGKHGASFAPIIAELFASILKSVATETPIDKKAVTTVATEMVDAVDTRLFTLETRCWAGQDLIEAARHAANVGLAATAIALAHGVPKGVAVDVAAAGVLHDIGHLLLPPDIRCIPEPLLEERARPLFRNHTFAGASTLLAHGCPPLWVAAALEHHRGVDGGGYPILESKAAPHELVRMIALANYYDRRRTMIGGKADDPDEALRRAAALEDRYFGRPLVASFLRALGAFPPGSTVMLSTREIALVTHANPLDPWRPQVRLVTGPSAGRRVDLKEIASLEGRHYASIVRAVAPPLLRPEEAAIVAPEQVKKKKSEEEESRETTPQEMALVARAPEAEDPAAPKQPSMTGAERARAELADMGGVLDALLTLKTDELAPGHRMAPAPMSASFVPSPPSAGPSSPSRPPSPSWPDLGQVPPPIIHMPALSSPPPSVPAPAPILSSQPPRHSGGPPSSGPLPPRTSAAPPQPQSPFPQPLPPRTSAAPSQPQPPYPQPLPPRSSAAPSQPQPPYPEPLPPRTSAAPPQPQPPYPQPLPPRTSVAAPQPTPRTTKPAFAAPPPVARAQPPAAAPAAAAAPSTPVRASVPPGRANAANRAEAAYLRRLGSLQSIPTLVKAMNELALDARSGFIVSFIDGASTIEDIIDVSGVPRTEVLRVLDDLLDQGALSIAT